MSTKTFNVIYRNYLHQGRLVYLIFRFEMAKVIPVSQAKNTDNYQESRHAFILIFLY